MKHIKKVIELLCIILFVKLCMEAFEVRQLPTFVSMTDIQSMSILDYVLGAFFHPVFFYTASIGCFIVVLFRMATIRPSTSILVTRGKVDITQALFAPLLLVGLIIVLYLTIQSHSRDTSFLCSIHTTHPLIYKI